MTDQLDFTNDELIFTDELKCELVNAGRISFDSDNEQAFGEAEAGFINFFMKNKHGSPFEHGFMEFRIEAPIFVFREWHRHRIGHVYNEMSGKYSKLESKFFVPSQARTQHTFEEDNKDAAPEMAQWMKASYRIAWNTYQKLLADGVTKEQARIVLPTAIYSKQIWSCNPRSLMHFLNLRTSAHATKEIRTLAIDAENIFRKLMPNTARAFEKNGQAAP